jgi:protein-tyrosine phosphatase
VRERTDTDEEVTFAEARLTDAVLGVQEDYLDAARRSIVDNYGSLQSYLDGAGVAATDIAKVRAALLG